MKRLKSFKELAQEKKLVGEPLPLEKKLSFVQKMKKTSSLSAKNRKRALNSASKVIITR